MQTWRPRLRVEKGRNVTLKKTALALLATLTVIGGCSLPAQGGGGKCIDNQGKDAPEVTTEAECEFRLWQWRKAP